VAATRVFHADDNEMFRFLVREALVCLDIELVGQAEDVPELIDGVRSARPDVVLLDRLDGPHVIDLVREAAPGVRIVMVSGHQPDDGDRGYAERADGYVVKGAELEEIRRAVRG
jgi:DNA-binding NarL/FixJ family response regulator